VTFTLLDSQKSHIPRNCREQFIPFNLSEHSMDSINLSGISELTSGYVVNRKHCPFHILIFVLEGRGICKRGDNIHTLEKGDVFFEEAGRDQIYGTEENWKILWFHLNCHVWTDQSHFFIHKRPEQIASLHDTARSYLRESRSEADRTILYSLEDLITLMIRRILTLPYSQDSRSRDVTIIDRIKRRVNRNMAYDWKVEDLAILADITPSYLYKITERSLGTTPLGLVRSLKMELAVHLLENSDYPLKYIAERIGYATPYTFSKTFKKLHGKSPGSLRKPSHKDDSS
jgi:AraC-like DNA-binding protein